MFRANLPPYHADKGGNCGAGTIRGADPQDSNESDRKRDNMAADKPQNLQDVFLNNIRKNKTPVTIFLVNGVKLQGIVTWFDNFSVLLRRDNHSQLVYKHAISTVMPSTPIQLWEGEEEGEAARAEAEAEA